MVKSQKLIPKTGVCATGTTTDAVEPFESEGAVIHGLDVLSAWEVGISAQVLDA